MTDPSPPASGEQVPPPPDPIMPYQPPAPSPEYGPPSFQPEQAYQRGPSYLPGPSAAAGSAYQPGPSYQAHQQPFPGYQPDAPGQPGYPGMQPYVPAQQDQSYGAASYGYAQPPYDYGYGAPYGYPGGPQPSRPTDGFAIASLVLSCVSVIGLCTWGIGAVLGVLGAIFGHIARRRIRASGAGGESMALAGIIVGWIIAALGLLFLTFIIVMIATDSGTP